MQFYIVDVFAEGQYTGNQLAVFRGNPDTEACQTLAREMNFSETTFITSEVPHNGGYDVRIFTPSRELPFAGHPTLGTAFIVREEVIGEPVAAVILNEKDGVVPVQFADDGFLWMQPPAPQLGYSYNPAEVADVLGLTVDDIDTRYPCQDVGFTIPFIIVPLKTLAAVQRAEVRVPLLKEMIKQGKGESLFVFAPEAIHPENDIHARCFVPLHGIAEDPATGSANSFLAAWLATHQYFGSPIVKARVEQGYSINRPSLLLLDAEANGATLTVKVGGRVNLVAKGELA